MTRVRLLDAGESDEVDVDRTVRSRRRRVLRVWICSMVIALVGIGATLLLGALFYADLTSSILENRSPALPDEARVRLEQVRSTPGFAATPNGATETESGISDHVCYDWFDGGEPRVWRTLATSDPGAAAARMRDALVRDGWSGGVAPSVDIPGAISGKFLRDFGGWSASVALVTDPTANTVVLAGMLEGTTYCTPGALD